MIIIKFLDITQLKQMDMGDNMKSTEIITIKQFLKELKDIDLDPYFQRGNVWDDDKKQKYLESFIDDYTVDTIVIAKSDDNCERKYANCDGKQRSTTIKDFFENRLGYKWGSYTYYFSEKPKNVLFVRTIDKDVRNSLLNKHIILVKFNEVVDLQKLYKCLNVGEINIVSDKKLREEFLKQNKEFLSKMNNRFKKKFTGANHEHDILKIFYNSNIDSDDEDLFIKDKLLGEIQEWFTDGTLKDKYKTFENKIDGVLEKIEKRDLDMYVLGIIIALMKGIKIKDTDKMYISLAKSKKVNYTKNTGNFSAILNFIRKKN